MKEKIFKHNKGLSYRIDFYFHDYKLPIETDENGQSGRNIDYEIKGQKAMEQELGCKFTKNDPVKEDFDIFKTVNEIFRHIKQSKKKKKLTRLLELEFKLDNVIKSKATIFIVKKYWQITNNNGNLLCQL